MCINIVIESKDEKCGCLKMEGQKQVRLGMAERVIYQKARELTSQQNCKLNTGPIELIPAL